MAKNREITVSNKPDIEPAKPGQVQIIVHERAIHVYNITDTEVDDLCSGYASIDFGLFTLCVGICVALLTALFTVQMSDKVFAAFASIAFTCLLGMIVFGFRTLRVRRQLKQRAEHIKASRRL